MKADAPTGPGAAMPSLSLLIIVSTAMPIGLNMYVPALAHMQRDLDTTTTLIQLSLSLYLAATAVAQIVVGAISDMLGRRPVLIAGMGLFTLGSLVCALAPSVEVLLVGRVVQAVGGAAGYSLARAVIRDVHGSSRSASLIGYVTMGMAVAPMVTPVIGGFVADFNHWRRIFDLMAVYGGLVTLIVVLRLVETRPAAGRRGQLATFARESWRLVSIPDFWIFTGTLCLLSTSFFSFIAGGPFLAVKLFDLTPSSYGLYLTLVVIGYIAGNFVTGRYGARLGLSRMIVLGNAIALCGVVLAAGCHILFETSAAGLFVPMLLLGLGNGFALPNAVAGAVSVRPELAGTGSGLAGAFQVGGGAVVTFLIGLMIDAGLWGGTVWVMLVPMLVGSAGALALGRFADDRRLG